MGKKFDMRKYQAWYYRQHKKELNEAKKKRYKKDPQYRLACLVRQAVVRLRAQRPILTEEEIDEYIKQKYYTKRRKAS